MRTYLISLKGTWRSIADAARTTIGMVPTSAEVSTEWRRKMLLAEHSPIRKLLISWKWTDLPYWISVHFVRHKYGIEHFVRTQRTDRTGINRNKLPQDNPVEHEAEANAQAIINISRKRLCLETADETREAWYDFIKELQHQEPELAEVCVPDCVYRGWCFEYHSCGYHLTEHYREALNLYRRGINQWEGADICK